MSFAQQNIHAFIELLKNQRSQSDSAGVSLFCAEYLFELEKLIAALPDDIEKISLAISKWYFQLPQKRTIHPAQFELLYQLYGKELGKTRVSGHGHIPEIDYQLNKEILIDQIKRSSNSLGNNDNTNISSAFL